MDKPPRSYAPRPDRVRCHHCRRRRGRRHRGAACSPRPGKTGAADRARRRARLCRQRPARSSAQPSLFRTTATIPAPTSRATRASSSTADGAERTMPPHENGYQNNAGRRRRRNAGLWHAGLALPSRTISAWLDLRRARRLLARRLADRLRRPRALVRTRRVGDRRRRRCGGDPQRRPRARALPDAAAARNSSAPPYCGAAPKLWASTPYPRRCCINTVPLRRPRRLHRVRLLRRLSVPDRRQERHAEHHVCAARSPPATVTLVTGAMVRTIDTGRAGRVTGVTLHRRRGERPIRSAPSAVILAGGAIETARLLLDSAHRARTGWSRQWLRPCRAASAGPRLSRGLRPVRRARCTISRGPGVSIATTGFNHGNPGIIGGGMLADDFILLPIIFWKWALPPGLRAGAETRQGFHARQVPPRPAGQGPGAGDPQSGRRGSPSRAMCSDRFGLPVARLSGDVASRDHAHCGASCSSAPSTG